MWSALLQPKNVLIYFYNMSVRFNWNIFHLFHLLLMEVKNYSELLHWKLPLPSLFHPAHLLIFFQAPLFFYHFPGVSEINFRNIMSKKLDLEKLHFSTITLFKRVKWRMTSSFTFLVLPSSSLTCTSSFSRLSPLLHSSSNLHCQFKYFWKDSEMTKVLLLSLTHKIHQF